MLILLVEVVIEDEEHELKIRAVEYYVKEQTVIGAIFRKIDTDIFRMMKRQHALETTVISLERSILKQTRKAT